MKKTYLAWIFTRANNYHFIIPHYFLLKKLSENFDKIYLINLEELKLYKGYSSFPNQLKINEEETKNFSFKKNVEIFNPQNKSEFNSFMKDKNIIAISNISRNFESLPIHLLLSKHKVKLIECSYIGNIQFDIFDFKINYKSFEYFFDRKIFHKIITILRIFGIVPKIEIKFTSFKYHLKKNLLKKFLELFNISYIKEYILINSRSYDAAMSENTKTSEEQITFLEPNLNDEVQRAAIGNLSEYKYNNHYDELINFLKQAQTIFDKKIVVCIHPRDNIEKKKKLFKGFEVRQFKTKENILKSSIVLFFDSSAIIDAVILKKKIITLKSDSLDYKFFQTGSSHYKNKLGVLQINIKEIDNLIKKDELLMIIDKNTNNYKNYIFENIKPDSDEFGYLKIIRIIKERYFN